jgi:hypothetical protein
VGTLSKPTWDNNFALLPATVTSLFGATRPGLPLDVHGYEAVALVFVDAFGWRFLQHYLDRIPILQSMVRNGVLLPLSSQFPSTTAVHVTTINTGLPIWESGVCEWHYYESRLDRVITPLPFETPRGPLLAGADFLPRGWFYPELMSLGVEPLILQRREYNLSPYARVLRGPARALGFADHCEGLRMLGEVLTSRRYAYYYFEEFDSAMHSHGPFSAQSDAVIERFFRWFEELVLRAVGKVLFLFTADHGMVHVERTVYLDQLLPESLSWLRSTARGEPILPCGSSRDLFLHVREEWLSYALTRLAAALAGVAEVLPVAELLGAGYFGPGSTVLERNLGDILIAPYAGESVFWSAWPQGFRGHHGGLTPQEMQTFVLAYGTR